MPEIQDILIQNRSDCCRKHSISYQQRKVLNSLIKCRTSSLGGHVTECYDCGHKRISYNSCRNRHCPKCQTLMKEKWIDHQKFNLLNVGYFHVVMTVPHTLSILSYYKTKEFVTISYLKQSLKLWLNYLQIRNIWERKPDLPESFTPGGKI